MAFVHLHSHDSYSLLDSAMSTKDMIARVKELGQSAVAQTNHGNLFGLLKFYKECKKQGVKPILGLEAYVAPESRKKHEKIDGVRPYDHLTLLAMNEQGLKNLFKLSTLGYTEGFYYRPRIDDELLELYNEGIICLSGCLYGRVQQILLSSPSPMCDKKYSSAIQNTRKYHAIFGDRYYIELQRIIPSQEIIIPYQVQIATDLGIKIVTTNDCHYAKAGDSKFQEQLVALHQNKSITDKDWRGEFTGLHIKTEQEMLELFPDYTEAVHEAGLIAERCNVILPEKYDYIFPTHSDDDINELNSAAFSGLFARGLGNTPGYGERLKYEIDTIIEMKFASYFMVVADYIRWAKEQGIMVGPGRGSAAGSLVAYCLGITNIDPIKYGLLFERFLNKGRKSMPDIDVDFCMHRRGEVIDYLKGKYGSNAVAQMATFSEFKPRGAIKDFARAQGKDYALGERAAKMVPAPIRGREPKWDKVKQEVPALWEGEFKPIVDMARQSDGMVKNDGVHAAGIVISPRPLTDDVPLFVGRDGGIVTQWEMRDIEEIGLVKMDILGITALTVMDKCLKLIKRTCDQDINIDTIDLEDSKVYECICKGDTNGLFQFDRGGGIKDLCIKLQPQNIEDLAAISALYRPGPLDCGCTGSYVKRKQGTESVTYEVPDLSSILDPTYGLMIYQEQAMKIATDLAGYSLEGADDLRKAIGKKLPEKMAKEEKKLVGGLIKYGVSEDEANNIWKEIKQFADYGFNKSHAVAYSTITYQTAWLKTYYPVQFYCALLTLHMKERDKIMEYLADCRAKDIQVLPPDINESEIDFTVTSGGVIRFGLAAIKDVGEKASEAISAARKEKPFKDFFDFYERTRDGGVNKKTIDALARVGAFDSLDIHRAAVLQVVEELIEYRKKFKSYEKKMITYEKKVDKYEAREYDRKEAIKAGDKPKASLKEPIVPEIPELVEIPEVQEISMDDLLAFEKEGLGLYVTSHPLYDYSTELVTCTDAHTASLIDHHQGASVTVLGLISSIRHFTTKKGKKMATLDLEDLNGHVPVTVFNRIHKKCGSNLTEGQVILLSAKVEVVDDSARRLIATDIEILPKKKQDSKTLPQPQIKQKAKEVDLAEINLGEIDESVVEQIASIVETSQGDYNLKVTFVIGETKFRFGEVVGLSQEGIAKLQILVRK